MEKIAYRNNGQNCRLSAGLFINAADYPGDHATPESLAFVDGFYWGHEISYNDQHCTHRLAGYGNSCPKKDAARKGDLAEYQLKLP